MAREYGFFEWDENVGHPGHRKDGSLHQNLYNEDGELAGHARFVRVEENNPHEFPSENTFVTSDSRRSEFRDDTLQEAIAEAISFLMLEALRAASPHIKAWWQDVAQPGLVAKARMVRDRIRFMKKPPPETSTKIELDDGPTMSNEEASARLVAAIAAQAYSNEQLRMVQSARIMGVKDFTELEEQIARLPAVQLNALISELVRNPNLLSDPSLTEVACLLPVSKPNVLETNQRTTNRE